MKKIICTALLLVAGCGEGGGNDAPVITEYRDAGVYVGSAKAADWIDGSSNWTVTTTRGVFAAYTSLQAPVNAPVDVGIHNNVVDGSYTGRTLRTAGQVTAIRGILAFPLPDF